jgi:hypothetical protein
MFHVHSIRTATVAALGVLLILWGDTRAAPERTAGAAETLEVQVLKAQVPPGQGERYEVLSVLHSSPSRVKPGDTIVVRSYVLSKAALDRGVVGPKVPALLTPGWIRVAYVNPDPKASGPEARRQFATAIDGNSFVEDRPGPPSLRYTPSTPKAGGGAK